MSKKIVLNQKYFTMMYMLSLITGSVLSYIYIYIRFFVVGTQERERREGGGLFSDLLLLNYPYYPQYVFYGYQRFIACLLKMPHVLVDSS